MNIPSNVLKAMRNSRIDNYALPGLVSHLIGGEGFGKVRLFESDRDTRDWIAPHSHRFNFACLVLKGSVLNLIYDERSGEFEGSNLFCKSVITRTERFGEYDTVSDNYGRWWNETQQKYDAGDWYHMLHNEIHSIRFSKGASVLFFEGPEVTNKSVVLEPWSNGERVPTFTTAPWMFQRERYAK